MKNLDEDSMGLRSKLWNIQTFRGPVEEMEPAKEEESVSSDTTLDLSQKAEKRWQPTSVLLPGKSHGQRSLVGCSPWGH